MATPSEGIVDSESGNTEEENAIRSLSGVGEMLYKNMNEEGTKIGVRRPDEIHSILYLSLLLNRYRIYQLNTYPVEISDMKEDLGYVNIHDVTETMPYAISMVTEIDIVYI